MVAASEPRPKDHVPPAEHPEDDCSEEECSNEKIPHPLAEQVASQLLPSMASPSAIASASTTNIGAQCPCPQPLLEALTLEFIGCSKKEELLAISDEEELLVAHGIAGKIIRVCSCVFPSFSLYTQTHKNMSPQLENSQLIILLFGSYWISSRHKKH